jgi:ornithine decarboxylase
VEICNLIFQILSLGVSNERIIFANTTKIDYHIQYAKEVDVKTLTFDNEDELLKIKKIYPTAK